MNDADAKTKKLLCTKLGFFRKFYRWKWNSNNTSFNPLVIQLYFTTAYQRPQFISSNRGSCEEGGEIFYTFLQEKQMIPHEHRLESRKSHETGSKWSHETRELCTEKIYRYFDTVIVATEGCYIWTYAVEVYWENARVTAREDWFYGFNAVHMFGLLP